MGQPSQNTKAPLNSKTVPAKVAARTLSLMSRPRTKVPLPATTSVVSTCVVKASRSGTSTRQETVG